MNQIDQMKKIKSKIAWVGWHKYSRTQRLQNCSGWLVAAHHVRIETLGDVFEVVRLLQFLHPFSVYVYKYRPIVYIYVLEMTTPSSAFLTSYSILTCLEWPLQQRYPDNLLEEEEMKKIRCRQPT